MSTDLPQRVQQGIPIEANSQLIGGSGPPNGGRKHNCKILWY